MISLRCKICGGQMELVDEQIAQCQECGSKMFLPAIDSDVRSDMFNRGNYYRMHYEFERAASAFEQIIARDPEDAEARFCLALCRYGVEYVRDPRSGEYKPTCHRANFQSFLEDVDYQAALKYATLQAQEMYRGQGAQIHEIWQHAMEIARYEEPYDVFLCYKESPGAGSDPEKRGGGEERTQDSVLAQELYEELTKRGARVFFSRITLEKKLGSAYEPYIFAALQSARVMLVVGTKREYLESVWVKNEWQRYLHLRKTDHSREIIPVLRGMEDYDLPDELAEFIPRHIDETGVKQDLIRGVLKITGQAEKTVEKVQSRELEKQGDRFLANGNMDAAGEIAEQMLNLDPDSMAAYRIRFLASQKVASLDDCRELNINFEESSPFLQLQRHAGGELKRSIDELLAYRQKREAYKRGRQCLNSQEYEAAYDAFLQAKDYKDAPKLAEKCAAKAEIQKKDRELKENIEKYRREVESAKESIEKEWSRLSPDTAAKKDKLDGLKWREKRPDLPMAAGSVVAFGMSLISINFQKDPSGASVMSAVLIGVVAFYLFYAMCILMKAFSSDLSFILMVLCGGAGAAFATAIVTAGVKTVAGKLINSWTESKTEKESMVWAAVLALNMLAMLIVFFRNAGKYLEGEEVRRRKEHFIQVELPETKRKLLEQKLEELGGIYGPLIGEKNLVHSNEK